MQSERNENTLANGWGDTPPSVAFTNDEFIQSEW